MLAGTPPFQGENLLSISNAILEQEQSPLTGSSSAAQSVVLTALRKDLTRRFQAATDLLGDCLEVTLAEERHRREGFRASAVRLVLDQESRLSVRLKSPAVKPAVDPISSGAA